MPSPQVKFESLNKLNLSACIGDYFAPQLNKLTI